MLSKKSFLADERNFSAPLVRHMRGNARDHIESQKNDHRPSHMPCRGLRRPRQPKTDLCEIFGATQFSIFSTASVSLGSIGVEGQVCITPMNGHRQFDWVASRNIGRQLGRAVDIPGVHPSERDASQLLRWRQRSSLTHAATRTASCFIDRARVCAGPNAFPSVTDRTRARRVGLEPSSRRSEQTWWVRRDRRRA